MTGFVICGLLAVSFLLAAAIMVIEHCDESQAELKLRQVFRWQI